MLEVYEGYLICSMTVVFNSNNLVKHTMSYCSQFVITQNLLDKRVTSAVCTKANFLTHEDEKLNRPEMRLKLKSQV